MTPLSTELDRTTTEDLNLKRKVNDLSFYPHREILFLFDHLLKSADTLNISSLSF